ncbi:transposase [Fulvivirga ulvae]|uniref:transposase n=1 Tax=Fulvivirga ulvae TaxID=2904245 RepID=UPI001F3326E8|nr:transposase [Fulvivirga ulvae]UII30145.1 transposase [Fulvivirga ulvae]
MSDTYQNKYRIASARASFWDYGWNASYFITICTQNREHYFGEIVNGEMHRSEMGETAHEGWLKIPDYFPFAKLGNHIVMPNHVHGIVIIDKPDGGFGRDVDDSDGLSVGDVRRDAINRVSTNVVVPDQPESSNPPGGITGNKNPMLHDNLSKIIRWYKGRTTFECRKIHADFAWQSRFHDHIIRNDQSFYRISRYIVNNPLKWKEDKFYLSNC